MDQLIYEQTKLEKHVAEMRFRLDKMIGSVNREETLAAQRQKELYHRMAVEAQKEIINCKRFITKLNVKV